MSKKLNEKKKFKRIRLMSSSSDEEESCRVQIDPGCKSSDTSPLQKEREVPDDSTSNLDNVDVACDHSEIIVASSIKNEYCNGIVKSSCTDVHITSNNCNRSETDRIIREFGPSLKMFMKVSASIDVQIVEMHYYLRKMLKEKERQEDDVADFKKLQKKLELLGKPAKDLEIKTIKEEFKKKAKVMGAMFIERLKQAMSQFNDRKSYITVIFIKTLSFFSNKNNTPSRNFIIKCRIAIQGMLELNCCKEYLFKFFFIYIGEEDFIRIIRNAWCINSLVSDIAKSEIVLSD